MGNLWCEINFVFAKVEYDEEGCFLESPYLFGEDEKYEHYMQVSSSAPPSSPTYFGEMPQQS